MPFDHPPAPPSAIANMPPEKRQFSGSHELPSGAKRPKPATTGGAASTTDVMAAAKAKAEAMAAKMKAQRAASKIAPPVPPTPPPSQSAAPSGSTSDRLAAMKARMAALKSGSAPSASLDAAPVQPPASNSSRNDTRSKPAEPTGPKFATTLGNRRTEPPPATIPTAPAPDQEETQVNPYFDPKTAWVPRGRASRGLVFNEMDRYTQQASKLRQQNKLEEIKMILARKNRLAKLEENSERGYLGLQPPSAEWWDEGLLEEKTYDCTQNPNKVKVAGDDSMITVYVQHPVLLKAAQDQLLIPVKPMFLTSKEQAKLRRMRRAEEHKEVQAKIRLGLEPPPPPKVKRGNMMRVMGEQAIADPTAVEMLVESQIQERQNKHETANEERKLTKEQRHEKLVENQNKDAQKGLHFCAFKIDTLAFGKHRYQIDQNAKQLALTGVIIFHPSMNLVIVEGGIHSIAKYKKLMLNRIKWTENAPPTEIQAEKQVDDPAWMKSVDEEGKLKDHSHNKCVLVFEGELKQRAFRKWGSKTCGTDGEAKEVLARNKLDSLWAVAKNKE